LSPLARTLKDGFDVVLPDARGHGKSGAPSKGYLYRDLAGDVVALIEKLSLDAPVLLGHSMGGMTAALVASQLGSVLSGVVLVDPTFMAPERQREVFEGDVAEEHRRMLTLTKPDLLAQARLRSPHRSAELLDYLVDARLQTSVAAFEVLTPPNPDYRELVLSIRAPILLVTASRGVVSVETVRELRRLNPLLQHVLIPDSGHGVPYDQPERLGAEIVSFLLSLPASCDSA
jgi:pimeloyl-ACP methyl ester carboxylesterase